MYICSAEHSQEIVSRIAPADTPGVRLVLLMTEAASEVLACFFLEYVPYSI